MSDATPPNRRVIEGVVKRVGGPLFMIRTDLEEMVGRLFDGEGLVSGWDEGKRVRVTVEIEPEPPAPSDVSVQPEWCRRLPVQQQSVLFLAGRGPDGIGKYHPCKRVVRAYRATVFVAARYGRQLRWGERSDGFMSLEEFSDDVLWTAAVEAFFDSSDDLPHHYIAHLMHGAQIVGYRHPDSRFAARWQAFYLSCVDDLHLRPETSEELDARLGDWNRAHWETEDDE